MLKKRILSLILTLCIMLSMTPATTMTAHAQATYNVEAALAYAAEHWNDGVGLCAEFASKVLQAGGINMKTQARVINCLKSAEKATGLTRTVLQLTPLKDYKGTTSEMATLELDGTILAPGDLVVQWCFTHNIGPHALICAGYDSQGYAVYYAHNGAMNKSRFQLGDSLAYEHTHDCNMGAYVLHVSSLDPNAAQSQSSGLAPAVMPTQAAQHTHTYNSVGKCTECGAEYSVHFSSVSKEGTANTATSIKVRPYTGADNVRQLARGETITINAIGNNAFGEEWYRIKSGQWVPASAITLNEWISNLPETKAASTASSLVDTVNQVSQDMKNILENAAPSTPDISGADAMHTMPDYANIPEETTAADPAPSINATGATKLTSTTVQVNGNCSYSGKKPSSVGLYFGTSSSSLSKKDSDTINHNKNPFDIWYNLSGLSPNTTYYYQLYAIVNGQEYLSSIKSFTTKAAESASNITINATAATKIKKNSAQVNGNCSYSGTRPSSVGLYFGTSKTALSKRDSDTINHSKNPFDIWYNLNNLSANTTYYYQLYAIVDGKEYKSSVLSFTTSK